MWRRGCLWEEGGEGRRYPNGDDHARDHDHGDNHEEMLEMSVQRHGGPEMRARKDSPAEKLSRNRTL